MQVERSDLSSELQPQNRLFSRIRTMFNQQPIKSMDLSHSAEYTFLHRDKILMSELDETKNKSEVKIILD